MILDNNFISIVFLGYFNPAILNNDFLKENKILITDEKPIRENPTTPVFKSIEYLNLKFIIDLERFQIIEERINNFKDTKLINIAFKYFDVLKYTPLFVCGINFNLNVKILDIENFINLIKGNYILELLNINSFVINIKREILKKEEKFIGLNIRAKLNTDKLIQLNLDKKDDSDVFILNYNYELRELDKKTENKLYIKNNYVEIFKDFDIFVKKFFKDKK